MSRIRVYEVARQLNVDQKTLVGLFQSLGFNDVRNHMSAVDLDAVERVKRHIENQKRAPKVVEERIHATVVKRRKVGGKPPTRPSTPSAPTPAIETVAPKVRRAVAARKSAAAKKSGSPPVVDALPVTPVVETPPPVAPEPEVVSTLPLTGPQPVEASAEESKPVVITEVPEPVPVEPVEGHEPAPEQAQTSDAREAAPEAVPAPVADVTEVAMAVEQPEHHADAEPRVEVERDVTQAARVPPPKAEVPHSRVVAPGAGSSQRPTSQQQRTGIETWAGRPGVPMRQPPVSRPPGGPVPRRVQYDPRANAAGKTDPRAGGARRGWAKGRRPPPGMMGSKKSSIPSTKEMSDHKKVIKMEAKISLQALAQRMSLKATEVLMKLLSMGMPGVNINSSLDPDTAKLVAGEFGWEVEDVAISDEEALDMARGTETDEDSATMEPRPPIVTVMGHVDHGKTSLLDQIRRANVAASEAGGITQHIGAYRVNTSRGPITFLDTPGHAAFTQMRARGAQVTDIVILVVAAEDGVMPQTREAVNHARAAKVPIIVAVNKIDKEGAQPERIRRELAELQLTPEEWGGETIFCDVSAKTREGIDALLEMTALQAELLELRANPKRLAVGTVIEALLDRGKGPVARVVVTDGTLTTGDVVLAGTAWGKVRAMTDDRGRQVRSAGPSQPVEILGLSEVPSAGDAIHVIKSVKIAQEFAQQRKSKASTSLIPASAKVSLEDLAKRIAEADQLELRLIIKADVQGSVEAVADALAKLSTTKVRVAIIHAGVGGITEGDVNLAVASKAIIIGFNVRSAGKAGQLAENESIEIRLYNVIYDAVEDVKKAMLGLVGPTYVEKTLGKAEVRQTFHIAKIGAVAGCMVQEGTLKRNGKVRLVRDNIQIWEGRFTSLKRFKDDAREVDKGFECGASLEGYNDLKVGDIIECYEEAEVAATL